MRENEGEYVTERVSEIERVRGREFAPFFRLFVHRCFCPSVILYKFLDGWVFLWLGVGIHADYLDGTSPSSMADVREQGEEP